MSLIAAKDVARHEQAAAGWMLLYVAQKLDKALALVQTEPAITYAARLVAPATLPLAESMRILQELHAVAAALLPQLVALDRTLPHDLLPAIQAFFDLAAATSQLDQIPQLIRRPLV